MTIDEDGYEMDGVGDGWWRRLSYIACPACDFKLAFSPGQDIPQEVTCGGCKGVWNPALEFSKLVQKQLREPVGTMGPGDVVTREHMQAAFDRLRTKNRGIYGDDYLRAATRRAAREMVEDVLLVGNDQIAYMKRRTENVRKADPKLAAAMDAVITSYENLVVYAKTKAEK